MTKNSQMCPNVSHTSQNAAANNVIFFTLRAKNRGVKVIFSAEEHIYFFPTASRPAFRHTEVPIKWVPRAHIG
jgi:hypothetical protein